MALRLPNEMPVYLRFVIHEFHRVFGYLSDTRRASPVFNDVLHSVHQDHALAVLIICRIYYRVELSFNSVNYL